MTQPVIKSGCVLRRANVGILERENLVDRKDVVGIGTGGGQRQGRVQGRGSGGGRVGVTDLAQGRGGC